MRHPAITGRQQKPGGGKTENRPWIYQRLPPSGPPTHGTAASIASSDAFMAIVLDLDALASPATNFSRLAAQEV
jgi:hypothetical protein